MTGAFSRRAALAAFFIVVGLAGPAAVTACGSFEATATPQSEAAPADGFTPAADAPLDAPVVDASAPGTCPTGAFCDSFDDGRPLPRDWSSTSTRLGGKLEIAPDAGLDGSGGLLATAFVADAATGAGDYHNAYMREDLGVNGPAAYTLVLSFSARVDAATSALIQGPRFQTTSAAAGGRELVLEFQNGFARLNTYAPGCDGGCALQTTTSTNVGRTWHHYVLTVKATAADAGDNGTVTLSIDEQLVLNDKLPFSLSALKTYGALVGLTYAPPPFSGTMTIDDVSVLFTPAL